MKNYVEVETDKGKAKLFKGFQSWETPKTYKKVGLLRHSMGNNYNSDLLTLFKNRQGVLKYEIYRDGSFSPFYGTLEFIKD